MRYGIKCVIGCFRPYFEHMSLKAHRNRPIYGTALALLAVSLLAVSNFAHIHVRYCMDGNEPSVSIHIETAEIHAEEHIEQPDNVDVETELSLDTLLSKLFDSIGDHAPTNLYSLHIPSGFQLEASPQASSDPPITETFFLPPLRAPPARV